MTVKPLILLLALIILILSNNSRAAQNARVITADAVIYADRLLKTPIGKVSKGKLVRVGSVARNHGSVLPIIVSGKVCWISIRDLSLDWVEGLNKEEDYNGAPRVTEHEVLIADEEEFINQDDLKKNNTLVFGAEQFTFNRIIGEDYDAEGNFDPVQGYAVHIAVEHRPPTKMINWGVGFGLYNHQGTNQGINWPTLDGRVFFVPVANEVLAFDLLAGIHLSGYLRMKFRLPDGQERESSGSALGFSGGAQFRLFPFAKYHVTVGAIYQTLILSKLDQYEYDNKMYEPGLDNMSGPAYLIALNYKFD